MIDQAPPGGLHGTVVSDPSLPLPAGDFRDTDGRGFRFADGVEGDVTALYFGFTHCDDVCPTTMADLASARAAMPAALAARVRLAFITVDPARDTPRRLRRWLDRFDPTTVGLRGSDRTVHAAERALYADPSSIATETAHKGGHKGGHGGGHTKGHESGGYEVNHTGSVYVFGPDDASVIYTGGTRPREYAADFERLLQTSAKP